MGVSSCWEWTDVERSSIFRKPTKARSISRVPEDLDTFFLRGLGFECLISYTGLLHYQINIADRVHGYTYMICPLDCWNRDIDLSGILSMKPMAWANRMIKFQSWLTAAICSLPLTSLYHQMCFMIDMRTALIKRSYTTRESSLTNVKFHYMMIVHCTLEYSFKVM